MLRNQRSFRFFGVKGLSFAALALALLLAVSAFGGGSPRFAFIESAAEFFGLQRMSAPLSSNAPVSRNVTETRPVISIGGVTAALPAVTATPGDIVVPITVSDLTGEGILSYDLQVTFDSTVVQPTGVGYDATGTLSSGASMASGTTNAGHLIISGFQGPAFAGSGTLLNLLFTVQNNPGTSTNLTFEDYTDPGSVFHWGFRFNEGTPTVGTTNGMVTIPANTPTNTATDTPTDTPTNTPTETATATFTPTPVAQCGTGSPVEALGTVLGTTRTGYATLKAAFDAINAGTHTGVITVDICGNTTETATASLSASAGASSYTAVNVQPIGGAWTITGSIVGAIVKLDGADFVTIDGRIGGTGRNLTVSNSNTTTATAAIWLASVVAGNGASNNIIRNLEVAAGATANTGTVNTFGIIQTGTTISATSTNGNDNDNNSFIANRVIRARYGIVSRGVTTNNNIAPIITDNIIGPTSFGGDEIGKIGIYMQADTGAIISRNTVQFVGGDLANTTAGTDRVGIGIGGEGWGATDSTTITSGDYTVTKNIIHDVVEERTFSAVGIKLGTTRSGGATNNFVANNFIYNVRANGTLGDQIVGIGISGGNGDSVVNNSISLTGDVDPGAAAASTQYHNAIRIPGANAANNANFVIRNNSIYLDASSSSTAALRFYAITLNSAAYVFGTGALNNNNYYINPVNPQLQTGGLSTTSGGTTTTQFATLALWQGALTAPQDAASIQADPLYVSNTVDLHLVVGSPNIDVGVTIGAVADDIDGDARPIGAGYEIGADETVGAPLPTATNTATQTNTATATNTATNTATPTATAACTPADFVNAASISSNDNAPGAPYPSDITVSGMSGNVYKVTVTLNSLTHTFPDDLDILLVGPGGNAIIMSDAGGGGPGPVGVTFTLDSDAATALPDSGGIVAGTFRPANYTGSGGEAWPAPAPAPAGGSALSTFVGTAPNGTWSLYVVDDEGGDTGSFAGGWTLTITTDFCPTPTATDTPTETATDTPTDTPTATSTNTATDTPTFTPTPFKFFVDTTLDTQDAVPGDGICLDGGGFCSLRAAITESNAMAGPNTISVPAGTYTQTLVAANEDLNAGGDWDITSDVIINGLATAATTFVEADAAPAVATERVFHIVGATAATALNVTINNLTVRNGGNNIGAGVPASIGAGIRLGQGTGSLIELDNMVFSGNTAVSRGGGLAVDGPNASTVNVTNCTISGNSAGSALAGTAARGGGITIGTATGTFINVTNTSVTGNTAVSGLTAVGAIGAGLYSGGAATTTFTNSSVSNNTASTSFPGSASATFGGGIGILVGTVTLQVNSMVNGNTAQGTNGAAAGLAGGIYNQNSTLNIIDSSVAGNTASDFHGGIRSLSSTAATTTNITRSTVSGNTASGNTAGDGEGGGIVSFATGAAATTTNIDSSTVSGNHAWTSGAPGPLTTAGGIENIVTSTGPSVINLTNSTVSGNDADLAGGIYNLTVGAGAATVNLDYSTVAGNDAATTGGGLYHDTTGTGGAINLKDSVVADNTSPVGPDIFDTITSQDYNHIQDTTDGTFVPMGNDVVDTTALMGALANNGGTTQTHLPGWPVADLIPAGINGCGTAVALDQRGDGRPFNGACDKGSVESQSVLTPSPTATNTDTPTATSTNTATDTPTFTPTPFKFFVDTTLDTQDAVPGDGICLDGGGFCSLRAAITESNAMAGPNTISVPAGTYTQTLVAANEDLNAGGDYDITSDVIINGLATAATTFVEADAAPAVATERVFHIVGATAATALNVTINNLTVRNGGNNIGAGVAASTGAGIRLGQGTGSLIELDNMVFSGNTAASRGGGIAVDGPNASTVNVTNCTISGNSAGSASAGTAARGGGITIGTATGTFINVTNTSITGNAAVSGITAVGAIGGGLYSGGAATTTFTNSSVSNNTASTSFPGSASATFGGGIGILVGTVTLQGNSMVNGNTAQGTNGAAAGLAGGIYNQNSTLNIIDSSVAGNTASDFHGGIRSLSSTAATTTNITRSTVSGNTASGNTAGDGEGGGIVSFATGAAATTTNIDSSTVSGNHAWTSGAPGPLTTAGGIENIVTSTGPSVINLTNSTVSGNDADLAGGIYNLTVGAGAATVNLDYSTVAGNDAATTGGGLYHDTTGTGGAINLKDSVVADNTSPVGPDIFDTITSQDYNHIQDTTDGTFVPMGNDVVDTTALMGALANNGGTTQTHLPGWPVADLIPAGINGCGTAVALDQRGDGRPFNGACDKGSVESQSVLTPSPTATNTDTPTATSTNTATDTPTFTPTPFKFFVDTTLDTQDAVPGDGICLDGGGFCSLRAAITESNAMAGPNTISVPAGTYTQTLVAANEDLNAGGDYDITSDVIINGLATAATTFVEADAAPAVATERVFHIVGATAATALNVTINNLTVRNGGNNIGAGVAASTGAGIRLGQGTGSLIELDNMVFSGNTAASRGGGIAVDGPNASTVNVTNCTISGNSAGSASAGTAARGGGITIGTATGTFINVTNTSITGNAAVSGITAVGAIGGGLYSGGAATTTFTNSSVSNNTASTSFPGSASASFGGGIGILVGTVTLQGNSMVNGNTAQGTNGAAAGLAGGIYNQNSTLNIIDSSVAGNTASDFHGGIRSLSSTAATTTNITRSTVSGNTASGNTAGDGEGGGIVSFATGAAATTTNIDSSTVSGNHAWTSGAPGPLTTAGGIENIVTSTGPSVINLTNSTVSGNDADLAGGIYNLTVGAGAATVNLDYSTVAGNDAATTGGGLYHDTTGTGGAINLKDSVVADNTSPVGPDIFGTITSQDYNHIQDTTDGTFVAMANDMVDTTAAMGALANNGGSTFTHLPGFPVVDLIPAGTNGCGTTVALDQRGDGRPFNGACDKGSVEIQTVLTPSPTNTATDTPTPTATDTPTDTPTNTPTPAETPSIQGTIRYGNALGSPAPPRFVQNVLVSGAGSPNVSDTTGAPGTYTLLGFGLGSYTVTLSKPPSLPNQGINSFDAARIQQHVLGLPNPPLTGNQLVVADVTGNNIIQSFDAGKIAQYVANLPFSPPNSSGTWRFYVNSSVAFPPTGEPTSRTYPSVPGSITGEDYTGLLMGEVSGNWDPAIHPRTANGPERSTSVAAPHLVTPADNEVIIPVAIQGAANKGIISYEFNLRYDPTVIQPQANPVDLAGTVSRGLSAVANANEPGLLRVVMYGAYPIDSNGLLLNLRFTAVGAPGSVSPLTWENLMFNEGDPGTLVTDGQVELSAAAPNQAEISGRLLNSMGQGIPNARVTLTDTTGASRLGVSNGFGVYRFGALQVGQTYTLSVDSRGVAFTPLTVSVTSQSVSVDLIAEQ